MTRVPSVAGFTLSFSKLGGVISLVQAVSATVAASAARMNLKDAFITDCECLSFCEITYFHTYDKILLRTHASRTDASDCGGASRVRSDGIRVRNVITISNSGVFPAIHLHG